MNEILVNGYGVVSPAGWGILPFRETLAKGEALATKELARPGLAEPLHVRIVPPPIARPNFFAHPRLRRSSPISQYVAAAAIEALGENLAAVNEGASRLGIISCVMAGCVTYSRRFYKEVLEDPAMASPLVFPETVFNAPASHLAALLGTTSINYTLVGDPGMFLQGLALATEWLLDSRVDGCLVIGAEEIDWLSADAFQRFQRKAIMSEGAGAVYLRREAKNNSALRLESVTDAQSFSPKLTRTEAAQAMRAELPIGAPDQVLCDSRQGLRHLDAAELAAWEKWPGARLSPKILLGEGLAAASAWQCVAALDALALGQFRAATVSVVGVNQQAIGATFSAS